ncbi:hypothetical protein LEP1GSC127_4796 [Leptospira kirschneri str. 200801925]|nr:hypothetical protein LEP1GSC127_4796 [Leptospira kirschneri str. 200801925]
MFCIKTFVYFNFLILFSFFTDCSFPSFFQQAPIAEQGVIDLRKFNLEKNIIQLNGNWEFYWKELSHGNFTTNKTTSYFPVPGIWKNYDPNFTPEGYATYRLRVLCECTNKNLKIRVPRLPGVYEVYLDDQRVYSNGFAGTNSVETLFLTHPLITNVPVSSGDFYITVNVSTFKGNYLKGGIRKPFLIGSGDTIDFDQKKKNGEKLFLSLLFFLSEFIILYSFFLIDKIQFLSTFQFFVF